MSDFQEVVFSPLSIDSGGAVELTSLPRRPPTRLRLKAGAGHPTSQLNDAIEHMPAEISGGRSTVFGASFNFVNSIVGAGIIGRYRHHQSCISG
jgi:hypothetical protein